VSHARAIPRYLIVGALCALIANGILIGFDHLGIHYVISVIVASAITLVLAYELHTQWTFGGTRSPGGLARYAAAMALNVPISIALLFVLVTLGGLKMVFAAPAATVIQTAFNYVVAATLMRPRQDR
jgi:putative flippase GtrA